MVTLQGKTILLMNMKLWNFALDILKYFVKLVNLDSSICLTCVMHNCDFVHCAKWMIFIFMHKSLELRQVLFMYATNIVISHMGITFPLALHREKFVFNGFIFTRHLVQLWFFKGYMKKLQCYEHSLYIREAYPAFPVMLFHCSLLEHC